MKENNLYVKAISNWDYMEPNSFLIPDKILNI